MNVVQNGAPFQNYGLNSAVGLSDTWQQFVIYFQASVTNPAARIDFYFGDQTGRTWLDGIVLQDTIP